MILYWVTVALLYSRRFIKKRKETRMTINGLKAHHPFLLVSFVHHLRDDSSKHTGLIIKVILLIHVCLCVYKYK
jgi:hypothetical protein